ncbi:cell division protein FtsQ/DivIB [Marinospirillum sp.]|uniref:cell division protein FtsQ/DivIB n=1 Tax=Marinospirillum sp. TaxID=2183934 RepID=UPI00384A651B
MATRHSSWQGWLKALLPLLLLLLAASYALHWMLARPVGQVSIYGEVRYVDQQLLQQRALPWLSEAFWKVDLTGLQEDLERDPWLEKAVITRRWPNQIAIQLQERQAWARWNSRAVLDEQGEAFYPANPESLGLSLHIFSEADQLQEALEFHQQLAEAVEPLDVAISELRLEPRGAWQLQLTSGVTLMLGRDNIEKRINRFIWVWDQWSEDKQAQVNIIDTRYPNGLSVGWKKTEDK